jgi:hypothetical protein
VLNKFDNYVTSTGLTLQPPKRAQKVIDKDEIVPSQVYTSTDNDEVKLDEVKLEKFKLCCLLNRFSF